MNWKSTEENITQKEIKEIQDSLGVVFPDDFIEHYLEFNGGFSEKEYFIQYNISYFDSFKYGESIIEETMEGLKGVIPEKFIPFAHDGGGWPYCISVSDDTFGNIYLCPLDGSEPEFLVGSFSEFLDGLSIEEVA